MKYSEAEDILNKAPLTDLGEAKNQGISKEQFDKWEKEADIKFKENEEKKQEAEYIFAERLLGNLIPADWSKESYERYKDGYLQGKVSFKSWERYKKESGEGIKDINNSLKELLPLSPLEIEDGIKELAEETGKTKTLLLKQFREFQKESKKMEKDSSKGVEKESYFNIFGIEGQVENLYGNQPFFYNRSGMFFIWDDKEMKYELCDEVDLLNQISKIGVDTITSKTKGEIMNALKQFGRKKIPEEAPKTWVQFKDKIYDFKTGETFAATPKYFITSPIPHKLGEKEDTPTIDKLFLEWVGKDYKRTLEEIIAYCCSSHQFMQRMIALVGGGSNGKGTYLKLLERFLGQDNCASSEIKELAGNQFETAVIYKKLLCIMGEVQHNDLSNSNQLKKLSGEDRIRFCFKGKTPFTEDSITTLISATNSMPRTPDKTFGFYRKWLIVDFPNQFTEIKEGLIDNIPAAEFENLARKVLRILKELYSTQKFTNEGTFQERMDRYEERSNPVMKFLETYYVEEIGVNTELRIFANAFNEFAKNNHQRIISVRQISAILREEGFESGKRKYEFGGNTSSKQVILNLSRKKNTENTRNTVPLKLKLTKGVSSTFGISGISGIPKKKMKTSSKKVSEVSKVAKVTKVTIPNKDLPFPRKDIQNTGEDVELNPEEVKI